MSLDYSNLRALFYAPHRIPSRVLRPDHDRIARIEGHLSSGHDKRRCPWCQPRRGNPSVGPSDAECTKWMENSPYNPFSSRLKFENWLGYYIEDLERVRKRSQKASSKKLPRFASACRGDTDRAFFALLRKPDTEEIERRIDVQAYADIGEMYFLAGLYEKERELPSWQKRKGERISPGLIDYAKAPAPDAKDFNQRLEQAVRADTTTREHQNRLCDEFQQTGMIGNSNAIVQCYLEIEQVCEGARRWPNQVPTLYIYGKPGTGKERVASAIHHLSRRKGELVTCNCATFPNELIESELFGHAKGAFTGANTDKQGLFKQASGGTLFLDEINKMSPNQQGKLLRALASGEIRKVGSSKPTKVDVLTLVASNEDLDELVKEEKFLRDLRSRLTPNPIRVPKLRNRVADVPLLVKHFLTDLPGTVLEDYRFPVALWCMEQASREGFEVRDVLNEVRRLAFQAGPPADNGLVAKLEATVTKLKKSGETLSVSELSRRSGIPREAFYKAPLRDQVEILENSGVVERQKRPPRT